MKSKARELSLATRLVSRFFAVPTTPNQVISAIHVYGVPYTDYYLQQEGLPLIHSTPNPVGQWVASYEGDRSWSIQGAVVVSREGRDSYYLTTWRFRWRIPWRIWRIIRGFVDSVYEIRLVEFIACSSEVFRRLEASMEALTKLLLTGRRTLEEVYLEFEEELLRLTREERDNIS